MKRIVILITTVIVAIAACKKEKQNYSNNKQIENEEPVIEPYKYAYLIDSVSKRWDLVRSVTHSNPGQTTTTQLSDTIIPISKASDTSIIFTSDTLFITNQDSVNKILTFFVNKGLTTTPYNKSVTYYYYSDSISCRAGYHQGAGGGASYYYHSK